MRPSAHYCPLLLLLIQINVLKQSNCIREICFRSAAPLWTWLFFSHSLSHSLDLFFVWFISFKVHLYVLLSVCLSRSFLIFPLLCFYEHFMFVYLSFTRFKKWISCDEFLYFTIYIFGRVCIFLFTSLYHCIIQCPMSRM